jgi:hypothetical protein
MAKFLAELHQDAPVEIRKLTEGTEFEWWPREDWDLPASSVSREKYQSLTDTFLVFSADYSHTTWTPFARHRLDHAGLDSGGTPELQAGEDDVLQARSTKRVERWPTPRSNKQLKGHPLSV